MKRRRRKLSPGDVFAIPLSDGTYALGQIAVFDDDRCADPTCVLFASRASSPERLSSDLDTAMRRPIGALVTPDVDLRNGHWPIIDFRALAHHNLSLPRFTDGKSQSYTVGVAPQFLEAYHGLRPWDEWPMSQIWYSDILLPGVAIPPTVRYVGGDSPLRDAARTADERGLASVTEGPCEIHIQILYPGNDLPTVDQLHRRQELERRLEAEGAGEVTDAGGGEGIMDVYLETDDVKRAMPIAERIIAELGLRADSLIETQPLEVDDDEEDDDSDDS